MRSINPCITEAVAREAARGKLGRSGQTVCRNLLRFRHVKGASAKNANKWMDPVVMQTLAKQRARIEELRPATIGVTLDATRLSGLDTLWLALCLVKEGLCCWLPPQAPFPPPSKNDKRFL